MTMRNSAQTIDNGDLREQNRKLLMKLVGVMLLLVVVSVITILVKN